MEAEEQPETAAAQPPVTADKLREAEGSGAGMEAGPEPLTIAGVDDTHPETPASAADGVMKRKLDEIAESLAGLERKFEKRFLSNRHNEQIIDTLHAELQQYKNGLLRQLLTPIVTDLIRLFDDLSSTVSSLPQREEFTIAKAVQTLATFPSDVNHILERQGLETFVAEPGERFDPARHRVAGRETTDRPEADRTVARSVRLGFLWEGKVFRPNMVILHAYTAPAAPGATSQT